MSANVTKENLQEFATKMHEKNKELFATKGQAGTPIVATSAASMSDTTKIYVYVGTETGYTAGNWYYYDGSVWKSGGKYNSGDWLSEELKQALLQLARKVAYIDEDGQSYYDFLENALYPTSTLESITAVYTQSGTVYDTDTLNSLKEDLVVTAVYEDSSTQEVTSYLLSGTLAVGTSTITVTYGTKSTTFDVTVTDGTIAFLGKYEHDTSLYYSNDTDLVYYCADGTTNRMAYVLDGTGSHAIARANSIQTSKTIYPVLVPSTATKISVIVPDGITVWSWLVKWQSSKWKSQAGQYIKVGSYERDITSINDGSLYVAFSFRNTNNDSGINSEDTSDWVLGYK